MDRYRVAEQIGAAFDNEETEADAVPMRHLLVLVEDAAEHLLRNADPRIRDLNAEIPAPVAAADEDSSCPRVLNRVLDQIVENAAEKFRSETTSCRHGTIVSRSPFRSASTACWSHTSRSSGSTGKGYNRGLIPRN